MRFIGELAWFLGVRIIRDRAAGKLWLCQDSYIKKLAIDYKINTALRPSPNPLSYEELTAHEGELDAATYHIYAKRVGSIIYPAVITRADVARAASKLAEHLKYPGPQHLAAADHCIRYLYGTRHLAIEYSATNHVGELTATPEMASTTPSEIFYNTADASYASSLDRRSVEGYTFKLFGGVIDWSSRISLSQPTGFVQNPTRFLN